MIDKHISGDMYVLDDNGIKGEIVVFDIDSNILGIKNLAAVPQLQNRGYGKKLINFISLRKFT